MSSSTHKTLERIGILGYGEVGQAVASFYENPYVQDLNQPAGLKDLEAALREKGGLDVLHICIPWSRNFIAAAKFAITKYAAGGITIIHSTIPVGTTEHIAKSVGLPGRFVVHSPVRGVHPNIAKGIKTFVKYIGSDSPGAGRLVAKHFEEIGIPCEVFYKSKTTELLKLLDTTYYGLCISFHAYADELCKKEGVSFENVMTRANDDYNAGYWTLKKPEVTRPILVPPENGVIGGHCVIPNAEILASQYGLDALLQSILRHKSEKPAPVPAEVLDADCGVKDPEILCRMPFCKSCQNKIEKHHE